MPHVPRMPHWELGCGFPTLALLFCWDVRKRAPKLRKKGISFLFYLSSTIGRLFSNALCSHVRIGYASETEPRETLKLARELCWDLAVGGIQRSSGITEEQEGMAELAIFTSLNRSVPWGGIFGADPWKTEREQLTVLSFMGMRCHCPGAIQDKALLVKNLGLETGERHAWRGGGDEGRDEVGGGGCW